jgi:hypothetical protein
MSDQSMNKDGLVLRPTGRKGDSANVERIKSVMKKVNVSVHVHLPLELVELLDRFVVEGYFPSRTAAVRFFVARGAISFASRLNRIK